MSEATWWLKDATVVCVDGRGTIVEGDVLVREGRIEAIGEVEAEQAEGAEPIDCSGRVVLPGFIQPHIHLCQTLMRSGADDMALIDWLQRRIWPYEAALGPDELHVGARIGLAELLLGGTTTILDMGTVHHTDAIGEAVEASGMRAFIGKCMMDSGDEVPGPLHEETDRSMRESVELCDRWDGAADGRIRYAFAPRFAVSCTEELLKMVAREADRRQVHIHTHASETEFENDFSRENFGKSNIAHLEDVGLCGERSVFAHGVHVSDEDCRTLAATDTAICHCPSSNLKLASGIANMPRYDEFGVQTALGADGAPCNNNLDGYVELRLAALLQKPFHGPEAMPAERVLRLATLDGARALGIDDRTGSVEVGKAADLQILNLEDFPGTGPGGDLVSRIVYSAQRLNVTDVFVEGRRLVSGGELEGTDLGRLMDRGRRARQTVLGNMEDYV